MAFCYVEWVNRNSTQMRATLLNVITFLPLIKRCAEPRTSKRQKKILCYALLLSLIQGVVCCCCFTFRFCQKSEGKLTFAVFIQPKKSEPKNWRLLHSLLSAFRLFVPLTRVIRSIHPWGHAPQSHQCKSIISHFSLISSLFTWKTQLKKNHSNELPTTRLLLKVALWNMKRPAHPTLWGMKTILMNWGRKTRNQWAQRISWAIYMTQVGLGLNNVSTDTDSKQGFVTLFNGMWVCADLLCELLWNLWPFLIRLGWFFAVVSVFFLFFRIESNVLEIY